MDYSVCGGEGGEYCLYSTSGDRGRDAYSCVDITDSYRIASADTADESHESSES